ncbi:heterokaryon incompatibility protein-domain-containing protein [Xylaria cf. heliscus]|nr:heterokaryon incompatibility protein-domain-containing protein [Xylaria cf. heliscus]
MSTRAADETSKYTLWKLILLFQAQEVSTIMKDLAQRDSRFQFINDSLEEFLHAKSGLDQDEMVSERADSNINELYQDLYVLFGDIVSAAIYELLNIFDINITPESIDEKALEVGFNSRQRINLLKILYEKSKDLLPQPTTGISASCVTPNQHGNQYQYPNRLDSSKVRVLIIQPGLEESTIECQLEERSINTDQIEEALSYVWGKPILDKVITVDGCPFLITTRLYNILRGLRRQDGHNRIIWIDAICINQLDLEEKCHQVRLMEDIYSKAQKISIWLGDWPTEQNADIPKSILMNQPNNVFAPTLKPFGGNSMDQYDLAKILEEFLNYPNNNPWDEKYFALGIMLVRCVNIIMMHEWWERVWTIQEAALPPNEPIIYFREYSFPYSTLVSAMDAACTTFLSDEAPESIVQATVSGTMCSALASQLASLVSKNKSMQLLRQLRPYKQEQAHLSNPRDRVLPSILALVSTYRSTDPRDKIFALRSLMSRSEGRLINVDYNEPTEAVFRRITARCFNRLWGNRISHYGLLIDSKNTLDDSPVGPSWVHDFTYSDADCENDLRAETTLGGILATKERHHPVDEAPWEESICLATPKTLFCSGVSISIIYYMKPVPDLGIVASKNFKKFLNDAVQEADLAYPKRVVTTSFLERLIQYIRWDNTYIGLENSISFPNVDELEKIARSPMWRGVSSGGADVNTMLMASVQIRRLAGTYIFALKNGIMGLATAPVQQDDVLAILHRHQNYVILREVEQQDDAPSQNKKHRIVARAIITEDKEKMKARIDGGLKTGLFQIV